MNTDSTITPTTITGPPARQPRYLAPGWSTRHVMNPLMAMLTRAGLSVRGSRMLHVQGRRTGDWQAVPVNPLTIDGRQYLVAPRGQTQWVRNLRAAGRGRLQLGRRTTEFSATEMTDAGAKAPVLQSYLRTWRSEVGTFFAGVDADSLDAIRAVADGYPVFVLDAGH
jgi:deazaflavin-dependent oxidoreductase (nitroreductase family)